MFGVYNKVRLPLEGMELGIRAGLPILGPPTGRIQPGPPKFVLHWGYTSWPGGEHHGAGRDVIVIPHSPSNPSEQLTPGPPLASREQVYDY